MGESRHVKLGVDVLSIVQVKAISCKEEGTASLVRWFCAGLGQHAGSHARKEMASLGRSGFIGPDLESKKRPNGPHWVQIDLRPIQKKNNTNKMRMQI